MCGIAGYFGQSPPTEQAVQATLDRMKQRGPDHQESCTICAGNQQVVLLHSRLSIIDLDERSNQPFTIGPATLVYNGEIYNYVELREKLTSRGVKLQTSSDTEVLLQYYLLYGTDCVDHFEGMWSFAIYDCRDATLFLSRDRFAEKPLYFVSGGDGLFFASETRILKSLVPEPLAVNRRHLLRNLVHGYKALYKTRETYFEGVEQLGYAENLLLQPDGTRRRWRYWHPTCSVNETMSLDEAVQGTRERLLESVRIRLRSDVPLAFCLSGGVDSASLVSVAAREFGARLHTFSIIDSDERYDERENILATVRDVGCPHDLIEISQVESLDRLARLIAYHDAPVATISYYVHSMISEAVSQSGYKVTFSGTSADELFTGYYDHFVLHLTEMREHPDYSDYLSAWQRNIGQFIRNPFLRDPDLYHRNPEFRDHVFDASDELRSFMRVDFEEAFSEERYSPGLLRNRMLNELFHEATPLILHEDDLNSMCYSVENRSPFLDTRLMSFAYSIPARHLIRDGYGKYVLREALAGTLNDKVRLDRRKKGFNASINSMVDFEDADVRDYLFDPSAAVFDVVERDAVMDLTRRRPLPNHFSKFLFNFINARIFLEMN